ncbi:serine hydrolase domain-containing protein [candidate division KSB1 bacterium]
MYKKIALVFFILFSCSILSADNPQNNQQEEFRISAPQEQGLDTAPFEELKRLILIDREFPNIHSLVVVRNGYLVVEEYFGGYNRERLHTLQSVSKSFTSAVMGIAIDQGAIEGIDEKILDFFPDIKDIQNLDDRKKAMTFKDLLTMRSGTDYHERGPESPHYRLNALSTGWDIFYLNRPMASRPGTRFQYDSGGVILMSTMLKNRTGMHADEFMEKYLFKPLGINDFNWFKNSEGHPHTGGGLNLRPRDMAKLGLLYLNKGKWDEKQVVPEQWVTESFKMHVTFQGQNAGKAIGYGYLWWIQEPDPDGDGKQPIYSARGAFGQYIFVIPEHNMVVAVTGMGRTGMEYQHPINFLYSHILKAVNK